MIVYRTPGLEDAETLANLGRESFCQAFAHLYASDDLNLFLDQVYTPAVVAAELGNPKLLFLVAEAGGVLVGYCKIGLEVSLDYDPQDRHVIELKQLYILQSQQGAGIGQKMIDWVLDQARLVAADAILLSVWSGNAGAQRFYKRYGFDWVADTYFMVGNHRDDEYLYLKPLTS